MMGMKVKIARNAVVMESDWLTCWGILQIKITSHRDTEQVPSSRKLTHHDDNHSVGHKQLT